MIILLILFNEYVFFSVVLPDSVLAFHLHGVQGRSLRDGSITQEICDPSKNYRLLGHDKWVILQIGS